MERSNFVTKFSERLRTALQKKGYISSRSKAGIEARELAKVADVSYQMARKYILGIALPDYHIIPRIAKWLNISPSWLLFGEDELMAPEINSGMHIKIDIELLKYILNKSTSLFSPIAESGKIASYIASVIYDASHINADDKTIFKIVDMMFNSAIQFAEIRLEKEHKCGNLT